MAEKSVHTESPTREVAQSLEGFNFPASKQELADYARKNNASDSTIKLIENLPDEQYTSMADVFKGIGLEK